MIKSASRSSITNDQKYRSMLAGTVPSSEYLIETRILDSTVASVTFSNLSQYAEIYKHLQIVMVARSGVAVSNMGYRIRFNGGSSTDYSFHRLANATSYADAGATYFYITGGLQGSPAAANSFGSAIIDILDAFNTSKNTVTRTLNGNDGFISLDSCGWYDTAAIDSITIEADAGSPSFVAGSRFSIYGVTA